MEESRQRVAHPKIIDRPELKSPLRHLVEGSITFALWAIWLYWILPLLTLFLWLLGFKIFYQELVAKAGFAELLELLRNGGIAILIIIILKFAWIYYNYFLMFKRKGERRKQVRISPDKVIAQFFKVDPEILEKAKKHHRINVVLEDKRIIIDTPHNFYL